MNKKSYLLILMTWFLGNLSIHLITPGLPQLAADFHGNARSAQLTISLFLLGKALSMLVWSTLSEYLGRKPIFISGLILYCVANLAAVYTETIFLLLSSRFLQGLAVGATLLMGRAMINDTKNEQEATRQFAFLFSMAGIFISFLPLLGSFLNAHFGWSSSFLFMAAYSFLLLLFCGNLSETHTQRLHTNGLTASAILIFKNSIFVRYLLISAVMMAGESAFNTSAPFILIKEEHYSLVAFGSVKTMMALMHVLGTFVCGLLARYFSCTQLVKLGLRLFILAVLCMWLFYIGANKVTLTFIMPMMVYYFGTGFIIASTTAASVRPFPAYMATALALSLFCQFNISALFSLISSLLVIEKIGTFISLISFISVLGLITWYGHGEKTPTPHSTT